MRQCPAGASPYSARCANWATPPPAAPRDRAAAAQSNLSILIAWARRPGDLADAAIAAGMPTDTLWSASLTPPPLRTSCHRYFCPGDTILLKGSRGVRLELVATALAGTSAACRKLTEAR